jgi:glyceraldehyde 3-phosphate dehydrogenase
VLPELNGKLDGYAIRVPTINVSIVDLSFIAAARHDSRRGERDHEGGRGVGPASRGSSTTTRAPLVSVDFNHDPASSTFDATLTKGVGAASSR